MSKLKPPNVSPGDWKINRYTNYHGFSIFAEGHGCIAERWWPTEVTDIPIEANACLMANSKRLAEALAALVEDYGKYAQEPGEHPVPALITNARAALLASGYTEAGG